VALRLLIYDRTCRGRRALPGLSHVWAAGRRLYGALGRLDGAFPAGSWAEALDWLATVGQRQDPIAEVQFWGHGRWGLARIGDEPLDASALEPGHTHHERLAAIARRMLPGAEGLWWFRTCETFGTARGHHFARAWSRFFGCRAAGHTYVIAFWQSGLHSLLPGQAPTWSVEEGLPAGVAAPTAALWSSARAPHTITCLRGDVPAGY
jgi:hypothetical protein